MIAAMDAVVHASYREGLARVLPQAMLAGLPVISYDIDGAREVVHDGETGFLVPPGRRRAAQRMHLRARGRSTPAAEAGRGRTGNSATRNLRPQHMTAEIRKLYQTLL